MIKNIFNFIYKYRIIVILFLLVLVLVILKIVTNQSSTQNSSNLIPTPTIMSSLVPTKKETKYIYDTNGKVKISMDELNKMDNETYYKYFVNLTEDERNQVSKYTEED